jgi:hypothetical protein
VNLDFLQTIASIFEVFGHRLSDNSSLGAVTALEVARDAYPSPADSVAYRNGENVADVISVVQGAAEIGGGLGGAAGAIAGGVACVGLTAGGCVVVVAPGVPAAVAAGGASATHGAAMLAKVGNGPQHGKTTDAHHAWPEYLGGSRDQPLYEIDRALHQKYHTALDKAVRRRWDEKIDFQSPSQTQLAEYFKQLRNFSHDFDAANGTETLKYLEQA